MLRSVLLSALFVVTGVTQAQEGAVQSYQYGDKLDVQRVISIDTPNVMSCEPVTTVMTYVDSQGQERKIAYRKLSESCGAGN